MGKKSNGDWFNEPVLNENAEANCPQCGSAMTREAVLCMVCGYNLKTGQYIDLPNKKSNAASTDKKRIRIYPVFIILVAAAFLLTMVVYVFYEPILEGNRDSLPADLTAKLPNRLERPKWMESMSKGALIGVYVSAISKDLDITHPMYVVGDTIMLRSESGKSGRGVFKGIDAENALLEAKGKSIPVPFSTLDTDCKLRADPEARVQYILEHANRRADAYMK